MFKAFLIKYAEIGIKGKNRFIFEEALVNQIRFALNKIEYLEFQESALLFMWRTMDLNSWEKMWLIL